MKSVKIATIALLTLIGSTACCTTTYHADIKPPAKPLLQTITKEQQDAIERDTWLKLQEREAQIKAYANKLLKVINQHNQAND